MDIEKKKGTPNPLSTANVVSKVLFLWILPLFWKGSKQNLGLEDMYDPLERDKSAELGNILLEKWEEHLRKVRKFGRKPNLAKVILLLFGKSFIFQLVLLALNMWVFRVAQPICLQWLIRSFEGERIQKQSYYYAILLCISVAGNIVCAQHNIYSLSLLGMRIRVACSAIIYRKTLKLSKSGERKTTVGQIINLLSNDVSRLDRDIYSLPFLLTTPVQFIIFVFFLWKELGAACFAGAFLIILLIPIQYLQGMSAVRYRRIIASYTDKRCGIMSELIAGIRIIKMYVWEKPFIAAVNRIRRFEADILRKRYYMFGCVNSVYSLFYKLVPFLMILFYVLTGNRMTADKVFYTVVICNSIAYSMVTFVQAISMGTGELLITMNRIQDFLLLEESNNRNGKSPLKQGSKRLHENISQIPLISLQCVSASWGIEHDRPTLKNLNFFSNENKLFAIIGAVGAGKSSLLNLLIGELNKESGEKIICGSISYSSQEPWIFEGTVRQNIIFGHPFDKDKYDRVTNATALQEDFHQFTFGDLSRVGERGISLSGGQKSRISLARALYQEADIYLMDDPFSTIDFLVGRHIFENVVKVYLKNKLRVLVTHQLQLLPHVDYIVIVEKGNIIAEGTFTQLEKEGVDFISLIGEDIKKTANKAESDSPAEYSQTMELLCEEQYNSEKEKMREETQFGTVSANTYMEFVLTGHTFWEFVLLVLIFTVYQITFNFADYWLLFWTNAEQMNDSNLYGKNGTYAITNGQSQYMGKSFYILMYSSIIVLASVFSLFRTIWYTHYFSNISMHIHDKMLKSVLNSPIKFFNDNPSGGLMNRFTKDLGQVDEQLPVTLFDTCSVFCRLLGGVAIIIASNYYIGVPSIFIFVLLWIIRMCYVKTANDVKRIESNTKSPVFSYISTTFQGLSTIRVSGVEQKLIAEFDSLQDAHTSAWFTFVATTRCFCVWIEAVSLLFVIIVTFSFLVLTNSTMPGNIGLAISSALSLANAIQYGMRQSAEMENLMTSAERALEYTKLERESQINPTEEIMQLEDWPSKGEIQFQNVSLSYGNTNVLKNVSFKILAKEKVGIVGRTGAGKSSIIQALLRMTEHEGSVLIDGISTKEITLSRLRRNISVIPQDPILFSGTIRYNLDPFEQFSDDELWEALEQVELKTCVSTLEFEISNGGMNFSVGQKQLLCLARAILRKNNIIVLDEATANVDIRTESLIRKTIREKFNHCTILTITHRLHNVIDWDKILVMDKGKILEFGSPEELILKHSKESNQNRERQRTTTTTNEKIN